LGDAEQLKATHMLIEDFYFPSMENIFSLKEKSDLPLSVRIRYRSKPIACEVSKLEDGRLLVHFLEEASAITPGQSAVFYRGNRVVGGAFIASQRGIGMYIQ
jgi:tRNA-specific 2-thiouridylase